MDIAPSANQSCSEVKDQGLCNSKSIVEDNHCQRSCNRCGLLVQRFNELLVCGKNDWKLGKNNVNTDICRDSNGVIIPKKGSSFSDIAIIEGADLYLAETPVALGETRPDQSSRKIPYKKLVSKGSYPLGSYYAPGQVSIKDKNTKTVESFNLNSEFEGSYKVETYYRYVENKTRASK